MVSKLDAELRAHTEFSFPFEIEPNLFSWYIKGSGISTREAYDIENIVIQGFKKGSSGAFTKFVKEKIEQKFWG